MEDGLPVFAQTPRREADPGNMAACNIETKKGIDPFVNNWIVNTNGNLYWPVRGQLPRYPIPEFPLVWQEGSVRGGLGNVPLPGSRAPTLVDLGCGWGRWCLAASNAGFQAIGVDIHVDAVQAARRVACQLGKANEYACADIDRLPFAPQSVDVVFSYSVLQHIDRSKVKQVFEEAWRILNPGGILLFQLPNTFGFYSVLRQLRRGLREARPGTFEMRYWTRQQIAQALRKAHFAEVKITADGFFSQNPQLSDLDLLSPVGRWIVRMSYLGKQASLRCTPLVGVADSLWVQARKTGN